MKKCLKIISLCICLLLMAGCMNAKVNMSINSDESLDIVMNIDLDMVKYLKYFAGKNGLFDQIKKEIITNDCKALSPYSEGDAMYEQYINNCVNETYNPNEDPTDEEIKKFLDELIESGQINELLDEDDLSEAEEKGFNVDESFDKSNYTYKININKHFNNIDDLSTTEEKEFNIKNIFSEVNPVFFTKTSTGSYKVNLVKSEDGNSDFNIEGILGNGENIEGYISLIYEVTLPNKAISNNATKVSDDGKTLTWDLIDSNVSNINYEFSLTNNSNNNETNNDKNLFNLSNDNLKILAIGLIAGGGITLVVTLVALLISNKKTKNNN